MIQFFPFHCISVHSGSFFFTGSWVPENKFSPTYLQQHVAENRAEPVKTMAASFARKLFLFSEVLSTVLGRFISEIDRQYAETWSILIRDGVAQIDSLGSISQSKMAF